MCVAFGKGTTIVISHIYVFIISVNIWTTLTKAVSNCSSWSRLRCLYWDVRSVEQFRRLERFGGDKVALVDAGYPVLAT